MPSVTPSKTPPPDTPPAQHGPTQDGPTQHGPPAATGLYDPRFEHDSCGVAFVADMSGRASHEIVQNGLRCLANLDHRSGAGAEANVGDGAGILLQIPDDFFRAVCDFDLPPVGQYAAGMAFLPRDEPESAIEAIEKLITQENLTLLGWRDVPTDPSSLGTFATNPMPEFRMLFIAGGAGGADSAAAGGADTAAANTAAAEPLAGLDLERRVFVLRKRIEHEVSDDVFFPSLSCRTIVYKGMLTCDQLPEFFSDLTDERLTSAIALVHSRFSTNTFPSWRLAHPYRMLAHNGEINTLTGNRNWLLARQGRLASTLFGDSLQKAFPIVDADESDSASFDNMLELLNLSGRSLPHAMLMMIPEAWENHQQMDDDLRNFYQFNSCLMEPWDGPASIAFTDGVVVGAVLDRNGLRPSRYWVTEDGIVVMASEVGVLEIDQTKIINKGRLQPGRMFLVDTAQGRIVGDEEIKSELAAEHPYGDWLHESLAHLEDLPPRFSLTPKDGNVLKNQRTFGYTDEDLRLLMTPMARTAYEPIGSMGSDTPIAALSQRPRMLFDYFNQLFAQVTNPPLDAIREELVTSTMSKIGPEANLLEAGPDSCQQIVLPYPVLSNDDLAKILYVNEDGDKPQFQTFAIDGLYPVAEGGAGIAKALSDICEKVSAAINNKASVIVLSDRYSNEELAPIPSLLLVAAVHHHLVRTFKRTHVGLIAECGDAREVHHIALLLGYGAAAVNPYVALETLEDMVRTGAITDVDERTAKRNYITACSKGVLKIMSKMGISAVSSYVGAQVFEAIGLHQDVINQYFTGTTSKLGGVGLDTLAKEVACRHSYAYLDNPTENAHRKLWPGGEYQWRREGEFHLFNPETVYKLQHSTRQGRYEVFKEYTKLVDDQSEQLATLRGLLEFRAAGTGAAGAGGTSTAGATPAPIPLDEVEPVSEIVKRFSTGAMSYGSISAEAHETLAIAMNRIGGKSNTGEGGEDAVRFTPDKNGDLRRSAIKQVASGRFGVTSEYLTNADDLQIKMAQGAKPGEGGQLPGPKVWPWIARTRHSTPGVGLISPPPHHDIYSIEDIKQLIHDLKNSNPDARVHVKLVSEVGVGTVAAGVAKAKSDVVLISGHDGGTGASPLTSLKHAGAPWELGLAETQQTLLLNGLRDRIVVQVDGQIKTGRDVIIAALLGAEEFGFATAPLVVSGCIMMRVCHLDTCPVGIATQNVELRSRYTGKPEFVVNFFEFIAQEVRELLAELGFRTLNEAIGRVDRLDANRAISHWKVQGLDLAPILAEPESPWPQDKYCTKTQDHGLDQALDVELIRQAAPAIERGEAVEISTKIRNTNRTVGTLLGNAVTKVHGGAGLPADTISVDLEGSAGQSFGAFLPAGITLRLRGDANDYAGKGLSGGKVVLQPPAVTHPDFVPETSIIAGNVALYGATGGQAFFYGTVGERFCVRNSGATAVVEGVGDHGCEYMTGGTVVVLGSTGRNFGAGMSGGAAFVFDPRGEFHRGLNGDMVDLERTIDDADAQKLREIVRQYHADTGSTTAEKILSRWHQQVHHFVKVMPQDYKRVLRAAALAEEQGVNPETAIMAAAHG